MQFPAQHIFEDHLLARQNYLPLSPPAQDPSWIAVFLLVCFVLLVLVKSIAYPRLVRIAQSTFSSQILQQLEREEVNLFRSHALALNLLFVLNVAFLIYKVNSLEHYVLSDAGSFHQYLFFLGVVIVFWLFHIAVNRILGLLTGARKIINEYIVSSALVNQTFGIILFPCLILAEFSHLFPMIFVWLALTVLAVSVLLKWYRGLLMCMTEEGLGFLQIFSYFCALEILPVLVLVKYVVETQ